VVVSALQLAVVLRIAGRDDLREMLALRRPTWSWTRVAVTGVLIVVGYLVLVVSLPFLQQGESQGNGAPFDPARALAFVLNAVVLVVVSPWSRSSCSAAWASGCSSASATSWRSS